MTEKEMKKKCGIILSCSMGTIAIMAIMYSRLIDISYQGKIPNATIMTVFAISAILTTLNAVLACFFITKNQKPDIKE